MLVSFVFTALAFSLTGFCAQPQNHEALPIVDLGYAVHRGKVNETGDLYAFKNIRFAEPPVGHRRFQPPVPVSQVNRTINDGSIGFICPQGYPQWVVDSTAIERNTTPSALRQAVEGDPRQNEDCLFLNVVVPRKIYDRQRVDGGHHGTTNQEQKGAAVMVWIFAGGYAMGDKDSDPQDPTGLLTRSQADGAEGVIYVAMNYRVGMYGFLNGGGDSSIFPNAGLQDQRLGLDWVARYIHLFGGDAERITVIGESSGGGSIMHHITAEEGRQKAPFSRAIVQSPGFQTVLDHPGIWRRTLSTATEIAGRQIRNGADLVALDAPTLFTINNRVIANSPDSTFTYGPSIDGGYVPDLPGVLLLQGKFDSNLDILLGHSTDEGSRFIQPVVGMPQKIVNTLDNVFPGIPQQNADYIWNTLYPPPSNETVQDGL